MRHDRKSYRRQRIVSLNLPEGRPLFFPSHSHQSHQQNDTWTFQNRRILYNMIKQDSLKKGFMHEHMNHGYTITDR